MEGIYMGLFPILPLFGAIALFIMAAFVYTRNKNSPINVTYALFLSSLILWLTGFFLSYLTKDQKLAYFWQKIGYSGVVLLPSTMYSFLVEFLNVRKLRFTSAVSVIISIGFIAFLWGSNLFVDGTWEYDLGFYYIKASVLQPYFLVFFAICFIASYVLMFLKYFENRRKGYLSEYNRISYVIAAIFVGNFGAIDFIPMYGVKLWPFGFIFMIFMVSIFAYAIVRHQLMDIRVAIKKTLIFGGIFAIAYVLLAFFTVFLQSGFEKFFEVHNIAALSTSYAGSWPSVILFGLKINIFSIPPFIVSLASLFLGIFVYLKNRKAKQNITFFLWSVAIFLWLFSYSFMFSCNDVKTATIFANFGYAGVVFIPIIFYHFVVSFLGMSGKKIYIIVSYLLGALFSFLIFFTHYFISGLDKFFWGYYPRAGFIHPLYILLFISLYYGALLFLYGDMKKQNIGSKEKNRILYLLSGFFIASFACVDFMPNYGLNIYPFGYMFIFMWLSITAYAIVSHKLFDIEVVIKKTLIFGGLFTVIYAIFAFFAFLGQVFFERFITQNRWISMIPSVLVVTIMLRPLENFLINITDRYLFQRKYDYKKLLKMFTSEVLTILNLDRLIKTTEEKLAEIMKLESCEFVEGASEKVGQHKIAWIPAFAGMTRGGNDTCFRGNDREGGTVPIFSRDNKIIGTLVLGRKKSDEDYTQEDLDVLNPLAKALGIAISNAKLFEELVKTRADMAQKDKMATIGTLAAGMAHEIRNPITTIRNFADYLPERCGDSAFMNKFGKLIPGEIDRVEKIARSLLEFSSSDDAGKGEEFAMDELVKTVIALLEPQYRTSEIKIVCDFSKRHIVKGSRVQLQDAFFHILSYVLAESQKGSNIVIECGITEEGLFLIVKNRDLLIGEHIIKDVFEPVSGLYKEKRGFGFNLFVAKQLLEKNRAVLKIVSDKTAGSQFRIDFKNASERP